MIALFIVCLYATSFIVNKYANFIFIFMFIFMVMLSTIFSIIFVLILVQADCELVKIDIHCHIQGDVVLECITLDNGMEREQMMFRVMFNTAFIRSNILMLNRDDVDMLWNIKDQFPNDFRAEVFVYVLDLFNSFYEFNI